MSKLIPASVLNTRFDSGLPNIFRDTLMYADRYATGGDVAPLGEKKSNDSSNDKEAAPSLLRTQEEEDNNVSIINKNKKKKINIEKMDFSNYYRK
jgi:hypothetical protein